MLPQPRHADCERVVKPDAEARVRGQMDVATSGPEEGIAEHRSAAQRQCCPECRGARELRLQAGKRAQAEQPCHEPFPRDRLGTPQLTLGIQPHAQGRRSIQRRQDCRNRLVLPIGESDSFKAKRKLRGAAQPAGGSNPGDATVQQAPAWQGHTPVDIDGLEELCPDRIAHVANLAVDA